MLNLVMLRFFSLFHKSMELGRLVQFEALNIFRYEAIAKMPPGGHGGHFNIRHYQIMYFASYFLNHT